MSNCLIELSLWIECWNDEKVVATPRMDKDDIASQGQYRTHVGDVTIGVPTERLLIDVTDKAAVSESIRMSEIAYHRDQLIKKQQGVIETQEKISSLMALPAPDISFDEDKPF